MGGVDGVAGGNPYIAPQQQNQQKATQSAESSASDAVSEATTVGSSADAPVLLNIVGALGSAVAKPNSQFSATLKSLLGNLSLPVADSKGGKGNASTIPVTPNAPEAAVQANRQFVASLCECGRVGGRQGRAAEF